MDGRSIDGDLDATVAAEDHGPRPGAHPVRYARGAAVGRYTLLEEVGAGAVGLVYAAYDPQLDRKVALKLLKPRRAGFRLSRDRLQREAQALAKLGHPNVVGVYDVGVHDEQVYVAMEFVQGQTLAAWIRSASGESSATSDGAGPGGVRGWRAVLEVFVQAGHGLAAAHEAGLVHRDFKPDNVMISDDGRVRVMDFGLARIDRQPTGELTPADVEVGSLTQSGAVLGTPAYMSPEQFSRGPVDARSDQFCFCVALWEALYGERPFAGDTVGALVDAITSGSIREPARSGDVPTWVRAVLARGLATEPQSRFDSMHGLLAALAADPVARRRRNAMRVGLVTVLAAGSWGVLTLSDEVDQRDAVIEEQASELDLKNEALVEQLSRQRGLRAITLVGTMHEAEALLLAVQAVGAYAGRWDQAPREAIEGLEQVLAHDPVFVEATHVLREHEDYLTTVAYSPDGSRLVSTALDGRALIWDPSHGRPIAALDGHDGKVYTAAFSPDGARIATTSTDHRGRIWDAQTAELITTLEGHAADLHSVVFAPDGVRVATAALEPGGRIWDAQTGEQLAALTDDDQGVVLDIAFAPDGARVVTASHDTRARVWDARDGRLLATLEGHTGPVRALDISPDGTRVATGSDDTTARLWDLDTGEAIATLAGHDARLSAVSFSPDGKRFATASWDSTGRLYDLPTAELIGVLRGGHGMGIAVLAYASDGSSLATGSYGGNAAVWDGETGELEARLRGHRADVWGIAFSPDGGQLATGSVDHSVRLWDLPDAHVLALDSPQQDVGGFAYSPDHHYLLTWTRGRLQLWTGDAYELVRTLDEWDSRIASHVAFARDGRRVAILREGVLRLMDVETGQVLETRRMGDADFSAGLGWSPGGGYLRVSTPRRQWLYDATLEPLTTLERDEPIALYAAAPDDTAIAISTSRTEVSILDPRTGAQRAELDVDGDTLRQLAYSPDGRHLVTLGDRTEITVWDADRLVRTTRLPAPADATRLAFSPDGRHLATGSGTEGVVVWDLQTGTRVLHLEPQAQETGRATVTYCPDGRRFAVSGAGFVRVHEVETGKRLAYVDGLLVRQIQFSPDGSRMTGLTQDRRLEVWDTETGEPVLREHVGVLRDDGSTTWPIPADELTRIGCARLRSFARTYPDAAIICDPLLDD